MESFLRRAGLGGPGLMVPDYGVRGAGRVIKGTVMAIPNAVAGLASLAGTLSSAEGRQQLADKLGRLRELAKKMMDDPCFRKGVLDRLGDGAKDYFSNGDNWVDIGMGLGAGLATKAIGGAGGLLNAVDNALDGLGGLGRLLRGAEKAGGAGKLCSAAKTTTALSPYRVTTAGETFIRYESANPLYTKITPSGVKPGTFAAPASDGLIPVANRVPVYNLPSPQIPRLNAITLTPPPGTPIIGPRPVMGGTGNEVLFPIGY